VDIFVDQLRSQRAEAQVNDTEDLWISCADALREQVSDAIWQAYLSGITPVSIKEHEIVLGVPNKLIRDRVESRFLGLIQDTVTGTLGRNLVVQLEVVAPDEERNRAVAAADPIDDIRRPPAVPARASSGPDAAPSPVLDPRYTFETFVIASSNRFAHAAAQSVAESPARSYNPLFIYGDAGLGKTHLLHAIGNYVLERPQCAVRHHRDVYERVRGRHPAQLDHGLQAPVPGVRRSPHRRRPVHGT
jgi:chromosomal replication initiator protein